MMHHQTRFFSTYIDGRPIWEIPDECSDPVSETLSLGDMVEVVQVPVQNIHVQSMVAKFIDSGAPDSIHQTYVKQSFDIKYPGYYHPDEFEGEVRSHDVSCCSLRWVHKGELLAEKKGEVEEEEQRKRSNHENQQRETERP